MHVHECIYVIFIDAPAHPPIHQSIHPTIYYNIHTYQACRRRGPTHDFHGSHSASLVEYCIEKSFFLQRDLCVVRGLREQCSSEYNDVRVQLLLEAFRTACHTGEECQEHPSFENNAFNRQRTTQTDQVDHTSKSVNQSLTKFIVHSAVTPCCANTRPSVCSWLP